MPKVTSGVRKSEKELKRERDKRYYEKKKLAQDGSGTVTTPKREHKSPETKRLDIVVNASIKEQKLVSPKNTQAKEKPLARFVGIDGEGKNNTSKNGTYTNTQGKVQGYEGQDYVLLRSSSDKLPPCYNRQGLSTVECFSYLCNLALKEQGCTFVGYGLSYDFDMWLRDLSFSERKYLREYMQASDDEMYEYEEQDDGSKKKKKVMKTPTLTAIVDDVPNTRYVAFEYQCMPRKWMKIVRYECRLDDKGEWRYKYDSRGKRIPHGSITVYDVIGFFQTSFMNALAEYNLLSDEDDARFIGSMKSKRDQFEYMDSLTIDDYCKRECLYLVKLMDKLQGYFRHPNVDIQLNRWDGAGAAASALLKKKEVKSHLPENDGDYPLEVQHAALHAYSGGHIELIQYGHIQSKKEYTEKQAFALCKKLGKSIDKYFVRCEYLRRRTRGTIVIKNKAITKIERLLDLKGISKPYGKEKQEEYYTKYVTPYLEHYYDHDHVGYFLPCLYDYDVNSAYPYNIAKLPSLRRGEWKLEKEVKTNFAMIHIKWELSGQRFYPFFYRTHDHLIVYPTKGENWVWLPEYEAYLKHKEKYVGYVEVLEVWNFYPASDIKPFAFIIDMANQRLEWKKQAKKSKGKEGGQHVAIKLALNSFYGKLAQQVGGKKQADGTWKLPTYLNMAWAGFITSGTRAQIFDAAMQKPDSVVMFATDGLFVTEELDLPLSDNLGEWEVSSFTSFTAVQAGVYYRETSDWQSLTKSRGFEKGSITEKKVLEGWKNGMYQDDKGEWQNDVVGTSRSFNTFGRLSTGEKDDVIKRNMKRLCCWERKVRKLSLDPRGTKREDDSRYDKWKRYERLVPTIPRIEYAREYSELSTRYRSPYYVDVNVLTEDEKRYIQTMEDKKESENIGE